MLLLAATLGAYDDRPPCYKQLERDFFHYPIVAEAFSNLRVPQGQWDPIFKLLVNRQTQLESIIEQKAHARHPDPLQHPFQSDVAADLLHETAFQIFERCLLEGGFYDTVSIRTMFDYIWTHEPRVAECVVSHSTEGPVR